MNKKVKLFFNLKMIHLKVVLPGQDNITVSMEWRPLYLGYSNNKYNSILVILFLYD